VDAGRVRLRLLRHRRLLPPDPGLASQHVEDDSTGHLRVGAGALHPPPRQRGRKDDPLYRARRTLHTGHDLLTDRQRQRLTALFGVEDHVQVEATWGIYQRMIAAYREPDRTKGRQLMTALIESVSHGVPTALTELRTLGRTLTKRADDVLAYFDRPGTSNGPTEAMNGRLEHLRGSALGFRNLTNYIARSLLETGGFRPRLHPGLR
jgi:transposase